MNTTTQNTATYRVNGMTCGHCERAVTEEVGALDGVATVAVDLSVGTVTLTTTKPVDPAAIAAAVDEAGYTVQT